MVFCFLTVFMLMNSSYALSSSDLQGMINVVPDGGTVTINSNNVGIGETILINRSCTINGSLTNNINIFNSNNGVFVGFRIGDGCTVNFNGVNFIGFKNYAISSGDRTVLSFDKCSFSSSRGGVISGKLNNLSFNGCDFSNNFNNSVLKVIASTLVLNNSNFKNNNFVDGSGSCIQGMGSNVSINNSVFNSNHADIRGGSISLEGDGYTGMVNNSRVSGNSANGGGFLYTAGKNYAVNLLNTNFNNNRAVRRDDNGGSSVNGVGGVLLSTTNGNYSYYIQGNDIRDNVATGGGGLLACFREGGSFTFNGNRFGDNLWMIHDILQIESKNNIFGGYDI